MDRRFRWPLRSCSSTKASGASQCRQPAPGEIVALAGMSGIGLWESMAAGEDPKQLPRSIGGSLGNVKRFVSGRRG